MGELVEEPLWFYSECLAGCHPLFKIKHIPPILPTTSLLTQIFSWIFLRSTYELSLLKDSEQKTGVLKYIHQMCSSMWRTTPTFGTVQR